MSFTKKRKKVTTEELQNSLEYRKKLRSSMENTTQNSQTYNWNNSIKIESPYSKFKVSDNLAKVQNSSATERKGKKASGIKGKKASGKKGEKPSKKKGKKASGKKYNILSVPCSDRITRSMAKKESSEGNPIKYICLSSQKKIGKNKKKTQPSTMVLSKVKTEVQEQEAHVQKMDEAIKLESDKENVPDNIDTTEMIKKVVVPKQIETTYKKNSSEKLITLSIVPVYKNENEFSIFNDYQRSVQQIHQTSIDIECKANQNRSLSPLKIKEIIKQDQMKGSEMSQTFYSDEFAEESKCNSEIVKPSIKAENNLDSGAISIDHEDKIKNEFIAENNRPVELIKIDDDYELEKTDVKNNILSDIDTRSNQVQSKTKNYVLNQNFRGMYFNSYNQISMSQYLNIVNHSNIRAINHTAISTICRQQTYISRIVPTVNSQYIQMPPFFLNPVSVLVLPKEEKISVLPVLQNPTNPAHVYCNNKGYVSPPPLIKTCQRTEKNSNFIIPDEIIDLSCEASPTGPSQKSTQNPAIASHNVIKNLFLQRNNLKTVQKSVDNKNNKKTSLNTKEHPEDLVKSVNSNSHLTENKVRINTVEKKISTPWIPIKNQIKIVTSNVFPCRGITVTKLSNKKVDNEFRNMNENVENLQKIKKIHETEILLKQINSEIKIKVSEPNETKREKPVMRIPKIVQKISPNSLLKSSDLRNIKSEMKTIDLTQENATEDINVDGGIIKKSSSPEMSQMVTPTRKFSTNKVEKLNLKKSPDSMLSSILSSPSLDHEKISMKNIPLNIKKMSPLSNILITPKKKENAKKRKIVCSDEIISLGVVTINKESGKININTVQRTPSPIIDVEKVIEQNSPILKNCEKLCCLSKATKSFVEKIKIDSSPSASTSKKVKSFLLPDSRPGNKRVVTLKNVVPKKIANQESQRIIFRMPKCKPLLEMKSKSTNTCEDDDDEFENSSCYKTDIKKEINSDLTNSLALPNFKAFPPTNIFSNSSELNGSIPLFSETIENVIQDLAELQVYTWNNFDESVDDGFGEIEAYAGDHDLGALDNIPVSEFSHLIN